MRKAAGFGLSSRPVPQPGGVTGFGAGTGGDPHGNTFCQGLRPRAGCRNRATGSGEVFRYRGIPDRLLEKALSQTDTSEVFAHASGFALKKWNVSQASFQVITGGPLNQGKPWVQTLIEKNPLRGRC